jgi:hypothetical protein
VKITIKDSKNPYSGGESLQTLAYKDEPNNERIPKPLINKNILQKKANSNQSKS